MKRSMKAAVLEDWLDIKPQEVAIPATGTDDVLIRVSRAGICGSDVHIYNGDNPIAKAPVIQGHEFMGTISDIGSGVSHAAIGDRVIVQPLVFCGHCPPCRQGIPHVCHNLVVIGVNRNGGFAEFALVPADTIFPIPEHMSDEVAVLAEPFSIGYHCCQRGALKANEKVLVVGGGPIGLYSAIVARELGASDVVISEPIQARREFAQSFGLHTVDPRCKESLSDLAQRSGGEGFQLSVESPGVDAGLDFASQATAVQGRIVTLGFPSKNYASYNVTRGIVKELSLIGSRVCSRSDFASTLQLLSDLNNRDGFDFQTLVTQPRTLDDVAGAIKDVAQGNVCEKILIKPGQ